MTRFFTRDGPGDAVGRAGGGAGALRPWMLGLFAALLALAVAGFVVSFTFDGEVTALFRIGSHFAPSPLLGGRPIHVFSGEAGYDGQQFLTLALDPFLR